MARPSLPSFFGRGDDPFGSLFREVQKTFEDFSQRGPFAQFGSDILSPKVDVAESKDAIEVTAELPGVDEKDLDVTLANGMLTVRGEKKSARDEQDKDKNWHAVHRQRLAERALARAQCPLGRNAAFIAAGPPWLRLAALDQRRHLPLECVGWPKEVGPEGDEQIAVVALGIRARTGEQSQRLHHERKPETFVAAERQQGAASCRRWIPGRLAPRAERDAFGK